MGPVVRTVHECLDVLGEKMSTTITGDAWDGATFELTDAGGGMSGTLDGAWLRARYLLLQKLGCAGNRRTDASWLWQDDGFAAGTH
jgi:hypothetical protein